MPKVPAQYLEARKNEILDAAMACFLRRGFHQTTMKDICREAQLSPGAVYRYFRSKEDIINASIDRNTAEFTNLIANIRSLAPRSDQAIEMLGRHFFARFRAADAEREARLDLDIWPEVLRDERLLATMRRQMTALRSSFVEMFRQAQTEGQLLQAARGLAPEHLYSLVLAAYQGLRLQVLIEPEAVDPEGVFQVLMELLGGPEQAPASPTPPTEGD